MGTILDCRIGVFNEMTKKSNNMLQPEDVTSALQQWTAA
jgi:hypothetical protein